MTDDLKHLKKALKGDTDAVLVGPLARARIIRKNRGGEVDEAATMEAARIYLRLREELQPSPRTTTPARLWGRVNRCPVDGSVLVAHVNDRLDLDYRKISPAVRRDVRVAIAAGAMGEGEENIASAVAEIEGTGQIPAVAIRLWRRVREAVAAATPTQIAEAERFLRYGPDSRKPPGPAVSAEARSRPSDDGVVAIYRDKLRHLEVAEAITSDAEQKFTLRARIQEARAKIQELGG
jgi:hypothetical protein